MLLECLGQIRSYSTHYPIFLPMGGGGGGHIGPGGAIIVLGIIGFLILLIVGMMKYDHPFLPYMWYQNFQRWRGKNLKHVCYMCDNAFLESQLSETHLNMYECEKCWNEYQNFDGDNPFVGGTRKIR